MNYIDSKIRLWMDNHFLITEDYLLCHSYMIDGDLERACHSSGHNISEARELLEQPRHKALSGFLRRFEVMYTVDADYVLRQLLTALNIALYRGNISAANATIKLIGSHNQINSWIQDVTIELIVDEKAAMIERLNMGRGRAANKPPDIASVVAGVAGVANAVGGMDLDDDFNSYNVIEGELIDE